MKKIYLIILILSVSAISSIQAQGLRHGECGVRFTYDAAGGLVKRDFFCNNSGVTMPRSAIKKMGSTIAINNSKNNLVAGDIVTVSSIMPNPTTGRFTVLLTRALKNENVMLVSVNGKVLEKRKESGNKLTFDISAQAAGMYFIRIEGGGKVFSFKVIKQ